MCYAARGSHVFLCFIDFTKAFDKINYWKLFMKLLDDNVNSNIVSLLAYWYSHQRVCVQWCGKLSGWFSIGNGTRQGGMLSPRLFARYVRELIANITSCGIGCNVGGLAINILAYADDLVLLSPSWFGMQQLLDILAVHSDSIDMVCNVNKTVCMVVAPKCKNKIVASHFPEFKLGNSTVQFVHEFKYLGHIVSQDEKDDADIEREIRSLFIRTNVLLRRFGKCTKDVKLTLFKTYCMCFYDVALWKYHTITSVNKLRSAYNKCIKIFFGFNRCYSVTLMLFELGIVSFDTLLVNGHCRFSRLWNCSTNKIVSHLRALGI